MAQQAVGWQDEQAIIALGSEEAARSWRMAELAEVPGYASALVVAGSIGKIHGFMWSQL